MDKKIESELKHDAEKYGVPIKDAVELYESNVKKNKELFGIDNKELALKQVKAMLAQRKVSGSKTFMGIFIGWDGQENNRARIARLTLEKKIRIEKLSEQDCVDAGIKDAEGNLLYPSTDKYNAGKPIKEMKSSYNVALVQIDGESATLTSASVRSKNVLDMIPWMKVVKFNGYKKEGDKFISIRDDAQFTDATDVKEFPSDIVEGVLLENTKDMKEIAKIIQEKEGRYKYVYIEGTIFRDARHFSESSILTVDGVDGMNQLDLRSPPERMLGHLVTNYPVNALVQLTGFDSGTGVGTGLCYYIAHPPEIEKGLKKVQKPQKILPDEVSDEDQTAKGKFND